MATRRVARVLIDSPLPQLDRLFDYAVPDTLREAAMAGMRVRVPLRTAGRIMDGYLVDVDDVDAPDRPLSELAEVVGAVPVLPTKLYELARRVADRAAGGAADILRLAVPRRMVRAEKTWLSAPTPTPPVIQPDALARARDRLAAYPGLVDLLDAHGRGTLVATPRVHTPARGVTVGVWAQLLASAAAHVLAAGRSAVLVVPDHRDQDQLQAALTEVLPPEAVVRSDARQSGQARYAGHLRTLAAVPVVVIGNRSAAYAPVHELGLLAVWDDGDPLLAEPLSPSVHARDVALVRQELESCALLFAGHTRTTDVQRLVEAGWVTELAPVRRVAPRIVLSATREGEARSARVPSAAFAAARDGLKQGPVLVQVSRPGYAPTLVCAGCRAPARCRHCGGPLRAYRPGAMPVCGWCARAAQGWECPHCGQRDLRMASSGSERTADELGRAFPDTRVIVADGAHPVLRVDSTPALVVATRGAEPVADGGYRAVLLLDGDRMLQSEQLRVGESCLRWWSNAAALSAPDAPVHLVGVVGPVARALATWTHSAYARMLLAERAPLKMPPTVRMARIDGAPAAVDGALAQLAEAVPDLAVDAVLGPVPSDDGQSTRALVRFDYRHGRATAHSLRASVIADALQTRSRRGRKRGGGTDRGGSQNAPRNTLRVRLDELDPEL